MMFKRKMMASLLISSGMLGLVPQAQANDTDELEKLRALVQELDQKVRVLERKNELTEEDNTAKKKETPVVNASEKGFGFKSADGKFEVKLRGLVQSDYRYFDNAKANVGSKTATAYTNSADANNTWLMRRIRPTIEGTVFDKYDFRFTPEFGEDKTTVNSGIVDAYVDARWTPWLQLRVGKFKPYVGLERLQSAADIKFVERSYVTNAILPNRDLGASLHGDLLDGRLSYGLGIFNGVVDGGDTKTSADVNTDKDYAVRLFATPFKDADSPLAGLGFGIAATYGNVRGTAAATELTSGYKTPGQQTFFKYNSTAFADGGRLRLAPQAYYYNGPFGLLAEYAHVSQAVNTSAVAGGYHTTLDHDAWQVAATWLLTGEDASFKGVKPKQVFDVDKGGWGAWELALRYAEINLDDKTFENIGASGTFASQKYLADLRNSAQSAYSWTAGVNWYLNPEVKFVLDYEYTTFDGGRGDSANPVVTRFGKPTALDREDERALLARFQVAF